MADGRHFEKKPKTAISPQRLDRFAQNLAWSNHLLRFGMLLAYGIKDSTDMSHTRLFVWSKEEWEGSFVFRKHACCSTNDGIFHWKCEESQFSEFYGEILVMSFHFSTQKTLDGKKIIKNHSGQLLFQRTLNLFWISFRKLSGAATNVSPFVAPNNAATLLTLLSVLCLLQCWQNYDN